MWFWKSTRPAGPIAVPEEPALIEARQLRLRRGRAPGGSEDDDPGLSFTLGAGEVLAVLGDNGSGKSLLLNYLAGVYLPEGEGAVVRIGGHDLRERAGRRRARRRLGVVFQQPALVHSLTIFENVALPFRQSADAATEAEIDAQVSRLLDLVGIRGLDDRYPRELSEGLQGCVALARALAGGKQILLCDEPTARLSPDKAYQIDELLAWLTHSGALAGAVVFTQNLQSALRIGTRFLLLGSGARFGEGRFYSHSDALHRCAEFQRFLQHPDDAPFFPSAVLPTPSVVAADSGTEISVPVSPLQNCL